MAKLFPGQIETPRLRLQRLRYEDADEIFYAYASKPEATRFVSWPTHNTVRDTRAYLKYAIPAWDAGVDYAFSIRLADDGRLVGSVGALVNNGKIQFGYVLSPTVWGSGFAAEACTAVLAIAKAAPGIFRIGTFVDVDNRQSVRVLEKCGLLHEATLEKWFRFVNQGGQAKDCMLFRLPF
jgi:ribosomal-protein-alanine N-acetyltransferase